MLAPVARSLVSLVRLRPAGTLVPERCACCGEPPTRTLAERRWLGGSVILVPYCALCHRHAAFAVTEEIAVVFATALLSVTCTLGVPLLWNPPNVASHLSLVLGVSLIPAIVFALRPRAIAQGHTASGKAAQFEPRGALLCRSHAWGAELAERNGLPARTSATLGELPSPRIVFVWGTLGLASLLVYEALFPVIHVVNASKEAFDVLVDDRRRATLRPAPSESPFGVVALRALAGHHVITARAGDGRVLGTATVDLRRGRDYLYAPASEGICFWVETSGYGRASTRTDRERLPSSPGAWEISPLIDIWFGTPPSASPDRWSSGGTVRALRRTPCPEFASVPE